jgi:hypothetical protein
LQIAGANLLECVWTDFPDGLVRCGSGCWTGAGVLVVLGRNGEMESGFLAEEVHVFSIYLSIGKKDPVAESGLLGLGDRRRPAQGEHPVHCRRVLRTCRWRRIDRLFRQVLIYYIPQLLRELKEWEGRFVLILHLPISSECPQQ